MLFLYRPRQTWMPYALPRSRTQQAAYNRQVQERFASTGGVAPAVPTAAAERDPIAVLKELGALHRSGVLTDAEFEAAKAKLLAT
jgi:Short C-terminal domain